MAVFKTPTSANLLSCQRRAIFLPIKYAISIPINEIIGNTTKRIIKGDGSLLKVPVLINVGIKYNPISSEAAKHRMMFFLGICCSTLILNLNVVKYKK